MPLLLLPPLLPLDWSGTYRNGRWDCGRKDRVAPVQLRGAATAEPDRADRVHGADLQRNSLPLAEVHALVSGPVFPCMLGRTPFARRN